MTRPPLIIIGASTRAAAWCAIRSGFTPWCVDQFGDRDLRDIAADVRVVDNWPNGIPAALDGFPDAPWMYAGALENSPDLIREISRTRPLLGCDEHTLRVVRDPLRTTAIWREAGLPTLPLVAGHTAVVDHTAIQRDTLSDAGTSSPITPSSHWPDGWIWKPYASAAGIGVHEWRSSDESAIDRLSAVELHGGWLQGRASGVPISGLYLAAGRECVLLGLSRQLHGEPAAGATGFLYCGSIGPLSWEDVPESCFQLAAAYGQASQSAGCGLTGLFGIDFIWNEQQQRLWPLEVNPRWTASAELYQRHHNWPLIRWHVQACSQQWRDLQHRQPQFPSEVPNAVTAAARHMPHQDRGHRVCGRMVVYAPHDTSGAGRITGRDFDDIRRHCPHLPGIDMADIPMPDAEIPSGAPLCTLLAIASTTAECHRLLSEAASSLRAAVQRSRSG